jgi:hypothetical protein
MRCDAWTELAAQSSLDFYLRALRKATNEDESTYSSHLSADTPTGHKELTEIFRRLVQWSIISLLFSSSIGLTSQNNTAAYSPGSHLGQD